MNPSSLTLSDLQTAVTGSAVAFRSRTHLLPAGGEGDKIFPPTYLAEKGAETKYAVEERRIGAELATTVLLDSVASQANRMEEALRDDWLDGLIDIPVISVDFTKEEDLRDLDRITSLDAPHRAADALLRDSMLGSVFFRESPIGQAITDARPNHATGLYAYCPTALVFGMWDSTGPKGGLGSRYARALTSEIVGVAAKTGVKVGSRIDPAAIERNAGPLFAHKEGGDWTVEENEAKKEKGQPVLFSRKGNKGKGKGNPAEANHGNIPPTIDKAAGGVTLAYAQQTQVLSLPALRRLRFTSTPDGKEIPRSEAKAKQDAARVALAALGLAAMALLRPRGFDLRSRSVLVADGPFVVELLGNNGEEPQVFSLTPEQARALLADAAQAAAAAGMGWHTEEVRLTPSPKLAALIRKSRSQVQQGEISESEEDAG